MKHSKHKVYQCNTSLSCSFIPGNDIADDDIKDILLHLKHLNIETY